MNAYEEMSALTLSEALFCSTSSNEPVLQTSSRFLHIPAEIRLIIYGFALHVPGLLHHPMTIEERQGYQRWWRERSSRFESRPSDANELGTASTVSNLLRVSKLVSNEAVTVFYSINKFRFPIFPHPIVPELPSQFSPHLRRAFLSFELRLNIPVEEAATYINNMARKVAESGAMLETFTLILWKTYDGNQRAGEIEARTVLQQAMSSGFLETRKAMARANGTLSSVNGPSLSPGWLWRLLDRPVRREGMCYTFRECTGTTFDKDAPDIRLVTRRR